MSSSPVRTPQSTTRCPTTIDRRTLDPTKNRYFANKGPSRQGYGFPSGRVWMWELDYKESWVLKNWCFWTVMLEKTLESPLDCKEIQPVHPKGNRSWVFIGRTDAEAETPIFWLLDVKNWLIGKHPDSGKDWKNPRDRGAWRAMIYRAQKSWTQLKRRTHFLLLVLICWWRIQFFVAWN